LDVIKIMSKREYNAYVDLIDHWANKASNEGYPNKKGRKLNIQPLVYNHFKIVSFPDRVSHIS
jgi:hypothetical protein